MATRIILKKKQTFRGYTRYPDKYFKSISIVDHLLCDVYARKCRNKVKVKGREWCQWPQFGICQGECRKIEIIIEGKTHITINEI